MKIKVLKVKGQVEFGEECRAAGGGTTGTAMAIPLFGQLAVFQMHAVFLATKPDIPYATQTNR